MFDINETMQQKVELADVTNISTVLGGCNLMGGASIREQMVKEFPLPMWLLGTPFAQKMRANAGKDFRRKFKEDGVWKVKLPGQVWTTPATQDPDACCWIADDLNSCEGDVPLKMLCLQSCEDMYDTLGAEDTPIGFDVDGLLGAGMTAEQLRKEIDLRSFALHEAFTISQGTTAAASGLTKPFHGLAQVMANPAIIHLDASTLGFFGAFDTLGCRIEAFGNSVEGMVIWVHPMTMVNIRHLVKKDIYGNLPDGWEINGRDYRFHNVPIRECKTMLYNHSTGMGTAYLLDAQTVGAILKTNLIVRDEKYIRHDFIAPNATVCGAKCDYYYNFGTVGANNANRLAVIQNIPTSATCQQATADLEALITPTTLIPGV